MIVFWLGSSGFQFAAAGVRNSYASWDRADSPLEDDSVLGEKDLELLSKLAKAGRSHAKFRRMIVVWADMAAPLYWWKQFDTYKVGTVCCSTSTMHNLMDRELMRLDFEMDGLDPNLFDSTIETINEYIKRYKKDKKKEYFDAANAILPQSYIQLRTVMLNYEVLANIYKDRRGHKLKAWSDFCDEIYKLPYAKELIICEDKDDN